MATSGNISRFSLNGPGWVTSYQGSWSVGSITRTSPTTATVKLNIILQCFGGDGGSTFYLHSTVGGVSGSTAFSVGSHPAGRDYSGTLTLAGCAINASSGSISGTAYARVVSGSYSASSSSFTPTWSYSAATFTIAFDANGGELDDVPASVTKTGGVNLTLPEEEPTRQYHDFIGWATSAEAATAEYSAGDTFSTDADTLLYAVWELATVPPTISNLSTERSSLDPTSATIAFDWAVDTSVDPTNEVDSVSVQYRVFGTGTWESATLSPAPSGSSGSVSATITVSSANAYEVQVSVTDADNMEAEASSFISLPFVTMDVREDGSNVAFGHIANPDTDVKNRFDCGMDMNVEGKLLLNGSAGTSGYVLTSNGANSAPTWQAGGGGGSASIPFIFLVKKDGDTVTITSNQNVVPMDLTMLQPPANYSGPTSGYNSDSTYFSAESDGIKCLKAGYIIVNASLYMTSGSGNHSVNIYKNSSEYSSSGYYAASGNQSIRQTTAVIPVSVNDVITVKGRAASSDYAAANGATFLTAQYLAVTT